MNTLHNDIGKLCLRVVSMHSVIGSIGGQELVEAPDCKVDLPGLEQLIGTY